jgi:hypothetical protein
MTDGTAIELIKKYNISWLLLLLHT